jgi:hypothetical protein
MEQEIAKALMNEIAELNAKLNQIGETIERIGPDDDKRTLRLGIANVMGNVYHELMRPVIARYPELDPDKDALSR